MTSSSNPATRKQAPGGETSNARTRYAPTKSELPHPAGLGTAAAGVGAGHRKRDRPSAARFPRGGTTASRVLHLRAEGAGVVCHVRTNEATGSPGTSPR